MMIKPTGLQVSGSLLKIPAKAEHDVAAQPTGRALAAVFRVLGDQPRSDGRGQMRFMTEGGQTFFVPPRGVRS